MRQSTAKRLFLFGLTMAAWLPGLAFSADDNSESTKHKDTVSRILQPKLIVDTSYLDQANFSGHSGGYALDTTKIEVSNLLLSFEYERFHFNWGKISINCRLETVKPNPLTKFSGCGCMGEFLIA